MATHVREYTQHMWQCVMYCESWKVKQKAVRPAVCTFVHSCIMVVVLSHGSGSLSCALARYVRHLCTIVICRFRPRKVPAQATLKPRHTGGIAGLELVRLTATVCNEPFALPHTHTPAVSLSPRSNCDAPAGCDACESRRGVSTRTSTRHNNSSQRAHV